MWVAIVVLILYANAFYKAGPERGDYLYSHLVLIDQYFVFVWNCWTGFELAEISILDRLPVFAVAAVQSAVAILIGTPIVRALRLHQHLDGRERIFFSGAIGWQVSSLTYLAIGLLGGAKWAGWGSVVLAALAGISSLRQRASAAEETSTGSTSNADSWRTRLQAWPKYRWFCLVTCGVIGWFYLLYAAVPPAEFDVREYHLQIPREWFQQGRIQFVPHNVYGNMPMGAELHALGAMAFFPSESAWWYGAISGKVSIACLTLLTAFGVFSYVYKYVGERSAWIAAIVYLSTPWIFDTSTKGLVEGAFALYLFATLYALQGIKSDSATNETENSRWCILAGSLAGAAASVKYTAVVFVVAPAFVGLVTISLRESRRSWKPALIFLMATAVSSGLWYAKNTWQTGNPVYPLLADHLGGQSWGADQNERWKQAHRPQENNDGLRYSMAQLRNAIVDVTLVSPLQSPLLMPGALLGLFAGWRYPPVRRWSLYIVVVFVLWWFCTHRLDRFLVPLVPLLTILAAIGLGAIDDVNFKKIIVTIIAIACALQWMMNVIRFPVGDPRVLVSLETLRNDPSFERLHPAHAYLNQHLKKGETAILVGDAQPFDISNSVHYNSCFDRPLLEELAAGRSPEQVAKSLRERRIRYVFVHWSELARYRSPKNYGYSDYPVRSDLDELVQAGVLTPTEVPMGDEKLSDESGTMFIVN